MKDHLNSWKFSNVYPRESWYINSVGIPVCLGWTKSWFLCPPSVDKSREESSFSCFWSDCQPEESPGQSTLSIHDVTDQLEGADVLEHLAGPSLGEDVIATIEEPNILLEEAHLGTDALSLGGEASAVNQDQMVRLPHYWHNTVEAYHWLREGGEWERGGGGRSCFWGPNIDLSFVIIYP